MSKIKINDCYVVGTALLYLKQLSMDRVQKIKDNLEESGILAELTDESLKSTVLEWNDFFCYDEDENIVLTTGASSNKLLMGLIFYEVLGCDMKQRVLNSVLNYPKSKVISFPVRPRE